MATLFIAILATMTAAQPGSSGSCGEVVTIQTHDRTTTRYALRAPDGHDSSAGGSY
jgi:hypothetical protein